MARKGKDGLTAKQKLVIEDMTAKAKSGKPLTPVESHEKVYNVSSKKSAAVISSRNMNNPDFRKAFLEAFYEKKILGADSEVESVLSEGLRAVDKDGFTDYTNRLKYAQEINKIAGVYAPHQVEKKSMHLNVDISEEELDAKIEALRKELEDK